MKLDLINSLIFAGVIQGFIFGLGYLFSKKYKGTNTFYLAALIITFSYNNLQFFLSNAGIISGVRMYETFYIPIGSLIPVFIYRYTLAFLYPSKKISKKYRLLYVPFFIFLLFLAIPYKIGGILGTNQAYYPNYRFFNAIQSSFSLVYTVTLILISFITVFRFKRNKQKLVYTKSRVTPSKHELRWLQNALFILFILASFWAFALVNFLINRGTEFYFRFLWLGLSIAIYYLGHFGVYKYGINKERIEIRAITTPTSNVSSIKKSKFPTENSIALQNLLVEQKQFLDPTLSLETLAQELQMSKSHLSRIINNELGSSFTEYINTLRVEEAKAYLQNPDFSKYTIVAIGLEAGFSSKTTFNTTFKKIAGLTPSQYRKNATNTFQ